MAATHLNPTREQFRALRDVPQDQPVLMINLLRFNDVARYAESDPEYSDAPVSGETAYGRYAAETEAIVLAAGGSQDWIGKPVLTVIGPETEAWDHAFVARYPSPQAFMDMVKNPGYQAAVRHRNAATADSRLICCAVQTPGATFLAGSPA
ncbi:MAG: DUF1330 domain-containing protein [Rhodobiaceae bacterium]|nr:DUF1330 domain-containing protein [Rhodobiaceae bacterium]